MKDTINTALKIMGAVMIFLIIFVRAGDKTTKSGGEQTGMILNSFFKGLSDTINSLTGA